MLPVLSNYWLYRIDNFDMQTICITIYIVYTCIPLHLQVQPLNEKEMAVTTGVYVRSGLLGFVGKVYIRTCAAQLASGERTFPVNYCSQLLRA